MASALNSLNLSDVLVRSRGLIRPSRFCNKQRTSEKTWRVLVWIVTRSGLLRCSSGSCVRDEEAQKIVSAEHHSIFPAFT